VAQQEEEKAAPPVRNYLADLRRMRTRVDPAGQDGEKDNDNDDNEEEEEKEEEEGSE